MKTMEHAGFVERIGADHFRTNIDDAIEFARHKLAAEAKNVEGSEGSEGVTCAPARAAGLSARAGEGAAS
jgi:hypothetical protein